MSSITSETDTLLAMPLADRLALLPKFYSYKDCLTIVFGGDEDGFIDAYCDGSLPLEVRRQCFETMGDQTLQTHLLRRTCRLLAELVREVRGPNVIHVVPVPDED